MLYSLLKIPARLAIHLYCRNIRISKKECLAMEGPLLIACNHPNSFLDAIILTTLFDRPVYSLARGDAFAGKFYTRLLTSLNMLPVYRASEGVENLEHNYATFNACKTIFKRKGIVLIFSEGRCINEWHLRKLMKGTARLAISSWKEGIPLKVLPTGINYNSFSSFGKNIQLNFGAPFSKVEIGEAGGDGKAIQAFNHTLNDQLRTLVVEADPEDKPMIKKIFGIHYSWSQKILLFIPAVAGAIIHFPLFYPIERFTWKKAAHIDHYDSIMVGLLFILYPLYILLLTAITASLTRSGYALFVLLLVPFTACCYIRLKPQF